MEGVGQPFVWGLFRGSIYVPPEFLAIRNAEHRRDVLAHELNHVLRFDSAVNMIQIMAQGLFWFHPCVWWANHRIRQEREKCCDEMAVARLQTAPKDYSTAIVETLAQARESARRVPSLAIASPLRHIEDRIRTLLGPGKRFYGQPSLAGAASVMLIALLTVPTAWVVSARGPAKVRLSPLQEVLAKYDLARNSMPAPHLAVVKSESRVHIAYSSDYRLQYRAEYASGDSMDVGDAIASILAWADGQIPLRIDASYEGEFCSLRSNGRGHLQNSDDPWSEFRLAYGSSPIKDLGWPEIPLPLSKYGIIRDDPYALDNGLICIGERPREVDAPQEAGTVAAGFAEQIPHATRFYLNPNKGFICQRIQGTHDNYAREVIKYGQTAAGQWYPLEVSESGRRGDSGPTPDKPANVRTVLLNANPVLPSDTFSPKAVRARYVSQIVSDTTTESPPPSTVDYVMKPE